MDASNESVLNLAGLTARDLMTTNVLTVEDDWPIDRLMDFLRDNIISGAPVVGGNGKLVGVVSVTDVARQISTDHTEREPRDIHAYYFHNMEGQYAREELSGFHLTDEVVGRVRDIMTPVIFDISEDASVRQVADRMVRGHIHRLVVTRRGQVVGIVTALDLLRVIQEH